jgi:hypothetical protein
VQVPHDATVCEALQLSRAVIEPQVALSWVQSAVSDSGVQPQTFVAPPPAQVWGAVQVPQDATERAAPQLSVPATAPQFFPRRVQKPESVSGVQPQTFAVPPPAQVWGAVQAPHDVTVREAPQLSVVVRVPQFFVNSVHSAESETGVHPQTLVAPAPAHVRGAVQVPHDVTVRCVPQLSAAVTDPQFFASRVQNAGSVSAVHPQAFATPPPPQVLGAVQLPHCNVPWHPSETDPHCAAASAQVFGVQ